MANKYQQVKSKTKKEKYSYPSRFGSHESMIDEEATEKRTDDKVVLRDEHGPYVTERSRLDTKLADPNRYSGREISK